MGWICVSDKLNSTSCADSDGHRAILTPHLCGIQHVVLCGYHLVNADQFCWFPACPEL
jgi:hypothetical protein